MVATSPKNLFKGLVTMTDYLKDRFSLRRV